MQMAETRTLSEAQQLEVARICFEAFAPKFRALYLFERSPERGVAALAQSTNFEGCLAIVEDGRVLGFAGTARGRSSFSDFRPAVLRKHYSLLGGTWRHLASMVSSVVHRHAPDRGATRIEYSAVDESARGVGVATRLVNAALSFARDLGIGKSSQRPGRESSARH